MQESTSPGGGGAWSGVGCLVGGWCGWSQEGGVAGPKGGGVAGPGGGGGGVAGPGGWYPSMH